MRTFRFQKVGIGSVRLGRKGMRSYGIVLFGVCCLFLTLPGCSTPAPIHDRSVEEPGKPSEPAAASVEALIATERRIDDYFRMAYEGIGSHNLTEEEEALSQDKDFIENDFEEFVLAMSDFMGRKLPYVNLDEPRRRDFAFLVRYGDAVYCYREYLGIDMDDLAEGEKEYIGEFRRLYPSGRMSSAAFPGLEPAALETLDLFVDPQYLSDRDLVLLYRLGIHYGLTAPIR